MNTATQSVLEPPHEPPCIALDQRDDPRELGRVIAGLVPDAARDLLRYLETRIVDPE